MVGHFDENSSTEMMQKYMLKIKQCI